MLGWLIGSTDGITSDYKAHSRSMTQVMFDDIETCELQFQKYILDRLVGEGKSKTEVFGMYRDKMVKNNQRPAGLNQGEDDAEI